MVGREGGGWTSQLGLYLPLAVGVQPLGHLAARQPRAAAVPSALAAREYGLGGQHLLCDAELPNGPGDNCTPACRKRSDLWGAGLDQFREEDQDWSQPLGEGRSSVPGLEGLTGRVTQSQGPSNGLLSIVARESCGRLCSRLTLLHVTYDEASLE